jgi:glycosyltransferase involved in cell wall biosynthesis
VSRVALVHDYLLVARGAERTFAAMAECWPEAPIFTTLFSDAGTHGWFADRTVETSPLQHLGIRQDGFRRLLPLYPWAVGRLDLGRHDVVVSSSSAFAHGVRPDIGAVHVCYCHNPFRYVWHERDLALREVPRVVRPLLRTTLDRVRDWDHAAASRITRYIANSDLVRQRIGRYYGREAAIVHPPVDVERFQAREPEDFFLVVCELVPHKRVDVALEAARRAGRRVKVVGSGPDLERLRARFPDSAELLGRVADARLNALYAQATALIVPNVEEFGIAAVEAQAAGRPVVGVDAGGTRETVVDGATGVLVPAPASVDTLAEVMREVDFTRFSTPAIQRNARRFRPARFKRELIAEVARATGIEAGPVEANPPHVYEPLRQPG